jgi:flagellar hook-associated protein 3 FlgL
VGSRLSALDQAAASREDEAIDLQALLAELRDVDYAQAISQLNQEYAGLQAAQAAYTRIGQLSLFDYLR